jgi:hypothetical protein
VDAQPLNLTNVKIKEFDDKIKEEKLSNLYNEKEIREISLERDKRKIILHKQNKNENTCVIDNLSIALEYET